ncbi:MAG: outer membrane protein assembly factor BamD [Alistipes sp.]|nr:outer membrane protein assembly factor BamD [Alistipes sp.]
MSKFFKYALSVAILSMLAMSASAAKKSINKIIKSGEPKLIYQTGMEYYQKEKWQKAATLFGAVEHYYIGTSSEDSIAFFKARCRFKDKDYDTATEELDEFRRKFGRSIFIEDAEGMYALCFYFMAPTPERDQTITSQALVAISEFLYRYPDSPKREQFEEITAELTQRLHDKAFINAYTYYKIGRHKSAIVAFRNALKQYPDSNHREELMYYIVKSGYELAHNSIESKQADRYLSMLDSYYSYLSEYPDSKHLRELGRFVKEAKDYIDKNNKEL